MRWWISTDAPHIMSVDNSSTGGMNFSTLPPTLWMVQWIDGKGEIEYQTPGGENLNGLREEFTDLIPYCPFFQQFLTLLPGVTLPQAKKVQCGLIGEIFRSKRQAPISYLGQQWDVSDEQVLGMNTAMVAAMSPTEAEATGGVNAALTTLTTNINSTFDGLHAQINGALVTNTSSINTALSTTTTNVNASFVTNKDQTNAALDYYAGSGITGYIENLRAGVNAYVATWGRATDQEIIAALSVPAVIVNTGPQDVPPQGTFTGTNIGGTSIAGASVSAIAIPAIDDITPPTMALAGSTIPWIPIGSTAPAPLTFDQFSGLIGAINTRRNSLNQVAVNKRAAVNGLTTIPAVIAYDVTTGW